MTDLELLAKIIELLQVGIESLGFIGGILTASIIAATWKG
jgi:hypothetical protein